MAPEVDAPRCVLPRGFDLPLQEWDLFLLRGRGVGERGGALSWLRMASSGALLVVDGTLRSEGPTQRTSPATEKRRTRKARLILSGAKCTANRVGKCRLQLLDESSKSTRDHGILQVPSLHQSVSDNEGSDQSTLGVSLKNENIKSLVSIWFPLKATPKKKEHPPKKTHPWLETIARKEAGHLWCQRGVIVLKGKAKGPPRRF